MHSVSKHVRNCVAIYLFILSFTFNLLLVDKWLPECRCYNGLNLL